MEQEVASGGRHGGAQCHQQLQQPSTIIAQNSPPPHTSHNKILITTYFETIYPSRGHNLPPTLEIIIRNFPKKNPKFSKISSASPLFFWKFCHLRGRICAKIENMISPDQVLY